MVRLIIALEGQACNTIHTNPSAFSGYFNKYPTLKVFAFSSCAFLARSTFSHEIDFHCLVNFLQVARLGKAIIRCITLFGLYSSFHTHTQGVVCLCFCF